MTKAALSVLVPLTANSDGMMRKAASAGDYITSFAFADLVKSRLPLEAQTLLLAAFGLAFAIKVPMVPLHTWLPDAHVEAPTTGSVILAGVMLKMGTYGFMKLGFPLFPDATHLYTPALMALAVVSIVYGACLALVQDDIKKIIAYSSISHLGYVMLGLLSVDLVGIQDLTDAGIDDLLRRAAEMEAGMAKQRHRLDGRIVCTAFFEPSTRTRLSFEAAAHRLGAHVIGFSDPATTSSTKGETAMLKVQRHKGEETETGEIAFVKENGEWKMLPPQ